MLSDTRKQAQAKKTIGFMSGGLLGEGLGQGGRKMLTLQAQSIHIWDIGTPDVKAAIDEQRVPDNGSGV
jgi:hypothetical protein